MAIRRLIEAEGEKVTDEQPWKLVTFCVQSAQDAADVSKRNSGKCSTATLRAAGILLGLH